MAAKRINPLVSMGTAASTVAATNNQIVEMARDADKYRIAYQMVCGNVVAPNDAYLAAAEKMVQIAVDMSISGATTYAAALAGIEQMIHAMQSVEELELAIARFSATSGEGERDTEGPDAAPQSG